MKQLSELPQDIDRVLHEGASFKEEDLYSMLKNIEDLMRKRLEPKTDEKNEFTIRFSKLGTPNRKLWYESKAESRPDNGGNYLKFIYGDIIEQMVLFLAKVAGHTVEDEQKEFVIDGIVGHQDAKIDGVTTDVKSTSSFSHKKFKDGSLLTNDPFGYVAQLSGYKKAAGTEQAAFLAVNKETGEIAVLPLEEIDCIDPNTRIAEIRDVLSKDKEPEQKCYEPIPHGKSGNLTLNKNCTYCAFKEHCWREANNGAGLRHFNYSTGVVSFVQIVETPRVEEVVSS